MNKLTATLLAALTAGVAAPTIALAAPEPTTISRTSVRHENHQVVRKTVVRHTTCRWVIQHHRKVKICR